MTKSIRKIRVLKLGNWISKPITHTLSKGSKKEEQFYASDIQTLSVSSHNGVFTSFAPR